MNCFLNAKVAISRGTLQLDVHLEVQRGETMVIVGPNGSGKSTLLRVLAGLTPAAHGRISIDGACVHDSSAGMWVPPEARHIGFVHQDLMLFEHLTVLDNVAFGPRCRGATKSAACNRAVDELMRVGLDQVGHLRPAALSGGQRQRVALARALAVDPLLLLMDEPLSALDATTATFLRADLIRRLRDQGMTSIVVTHDPIDALLLGDRLSILEAGRIIQTGTPQDVAERPASDYVARLLGLQLLRGSAHAGTVDIDGGGQLQISQTHLTGRVVLSIRPAAVSLHRTRPEGSARNVWQATIASIVPLGDRVRVGIQGQPTLAGDITPAALAELSLSSGGAVWVSLKATEIDAFADPTGDQTPALNATEGISQG